MTIAVTRLTSGESSYNTSFSTASISLPFKNQTKRTLVIVNTYWRRGSTSAPSNPTVTKTGQSFSPWSHGGWAFAMDINLAQGNVFETSGSVRYAHHVHMAWVRQSDWSDGAITITPGWTMASGDYVAWDVYAVTGVHDDGGTSTVCYNGFYRTFSSYAVNGGSNAPAVSQMQSATGYNGEALVITATRASGASLTVGGSYTEVGSEQSLTYWTSQAFTTPAAETSIGATWSTGTQWTAVAFIFVPEDNPGVRFIGTHAGTVKSDTSTMSLTPSSTSYDGLRDNDLGFIILAGQAYSSAGEGTAYQGTTGWTQLSTYYAGSASHRITVLYKFASGGSLTFPTFNFTNSWVNFGVGGGYAISGIIRGVASSVTGATTGTGAVAANAAHPVLTPSQAGNLQLLIVGGNENSGSYPYASFAGPGALGTYDAEGRYCSSAGGNATADSVISINWLPCPTTTTPNAGQMSNVALAYTVIDLLYVGENFIDASDGLLAGPIGSFTLTPVDAAAFITFDGKLGNPAASVTLRAFRLPSARGRRPIVWVENLSQVRSGSIA